MKVLVSICVFVLGLYAAAFAGHDGSSSISLDLATHGRFIVEVNGFPYPTDTRGSFKLDGLSCGDYNVRVYQVGMYHPNAGDRLLFSQLVFLPDNTLLSGRLTRQGLVFRSIPKAHHRMRHPAKYNPVIAMAPSTFGQLMSRLNEMPFDKAKLEMACAAVRANGVSTSQVAQIMKTFSFDNYKLEFAKQAYSHCADPQQYFLLADEFTFRSNAQTLMLYIR